MERKVNAVTIITGYYVGPDGHVYTNYLPASVIYASPECNTFWDANRHAHGQHSRGNARTNVRRADRGGRAAELFPETG